MKFTKNQKSAKPQRHAHNTPETKARHNPRLKLPPVVEDVPKEAPDLSAKPKTERLFWEGAISNAKFDKQEALKLFWAANHLPDKAPQIIRGKNPELTPADSTYGLFWNPMKRNLQNRRQGEDKGYINPAHREIYDQLITQLSKEHLLRVRKAMVALHLRSGDGVFFLVLQVKPESPNTWREINRFSEWIQREMPLIQGCYVAQGSDRPFRFGETRGIQLKKEFGPDTLHAQVGDFRHFYHILDEQESDRSLILAHSDVVKQLIKPTPEQSILVLSAGCPAYVHTLSKEARIVGVFDPSPLAREGYARNRERHEWKNVRFTQFKEAQSWEQLPAANSIVSAWHQILTVEQMEALAATGADRIVRRFRSPDELSREWGKWRKMGWVLYRLKVLDGNPMHSNQVDVWALFQKDHRGILKITKDAKKAKFKEEFHSSRKENADFYGSGSRSEGRTRSNDRGRSEDHNRTDKSPRRASGRTASADRSAPKSSGNFPKFVQR